MPKIGKNKSEDEAAVESPDFDRPTDPVTDNILPVDPAPAIPSRIKVDKYLIDDIVVPEIEPVDLIPLDPTGFLFLPEHGIKEELEGLDFEHEQNQIIRETLEDFLLNSDEIERKFDYNQIIEQLQDELGLPKQKGYGFSPVSLNKSVLDRRFDTCFSLDSSAKRCRDRNVMIHSYLDSVIFSTI